MKKLSLIFSIALAFAFVMSGCDKEGNNTVTGNQTSITYKVGTEDFNLNQVYQDKTGRNFTISRIQFYVSGISLTTNGGNTISFPDEHLVITPDQSVYELPDVPAGNYSMLSFNVGVDTPANNSDPTLYPASNPLSIQHPWFAHWSWNSGYRFIVVEGLVDTSAAGTGTPSGLLEYHLGTNNLLRNVSFNSPIEVSEDNPFSMSLEVDILEIFDQIDLSTEDGSVSHTMDNMSIAMQVSNNFAAAIEAQ